ncbi:MAG: hypothetical protein ACKVQJ_00415 [Pyrinomonadaceae bacterium]
MTTSKSIAILALFSTIAVCFGCGGSAIKSANAKPGANSANENSNAAKTNVEELGILINVPYETEDVVWKENTARKKLVAVLRFSPADSAKLVAEAEKTRAPEAATLSSETWFPAELIAQSEMSGNDELKGQSYAADQFFLAPYTSGRIVRIEGTDYFVIELSAK